MSVKVTWRESGVLGGPNYVRDGDIQVEMRISPLPICPQCKKTETVFNPTKGPHPSRWGCKECGIEWGQEAFS